MIPYLFPPLGKKDQYFIENQLLYIGFITYENSKLL